MLHESPLCGICGANSSGLYKGSKKIKNGITFRPTVCYTCVSSSPNPTYCPYCEDIYFPPTSWLSELDEYQILSNIPCPQHSQLTDIPAYKCDACGALESAFYSFTERNKGLCIECSFNTVVCSAVYCTVQLHPNFSDTVSSIGGTKHYCGPCAEVKSMPFRYPKGWHPLTWDYKSECICPCCTHLRGRCEEKWPTVISSQSHTPVKCVICSDPTYIEHSLPINNGYACHICSLGIIKCTTCDTRLIESESHPAIDGSLFQRCPACFEAAGYYLCLGACQAWVPNEDDCDCTGVLPYDYTPNHFKYLTSRREGNVNQDKVPFFGIELEVEAQRKSTSKKAGARLVQKLASEWSYTVHDGTLLGDGPGYGTSPYNGSLGFEIVTHPFTFAWFNERWDDIESLLVKLSSKGYRSWEGGRCGIHINISRRPMSEGHQTKFINFFYDHQKLACCVGQRPVGSLGVQKYAAFDKENRAQFLSSKVRSHINPGIPGNKHYVALNANKPSRLEARWFRGTLNPFSFRKNVEFIHSVWYFTKAYGFSSANEVNYVSWLQDAQHSNQYKNIRKYLTDNYITKR